MTPSDERLKWGIAAYKQGRKQAASQYIKEAIQLDPQNEKAWLWLSGVVDSDEQRRDCLRRVLAINPDNRTARLGLEKLTAEPEKAILLPKPNPTPPPYAPPILSPTILPPDPVSAEYEPAKDFIEPELATLKKEKDGPRLRAALSIGVVVILLAWVVYFFVSRPQAGLILLDMIVQQLPSEEFSAEEETAVLNTIYENIAAANSENVERYMASLHTQSPRYENTRERLETLYQAYDLTVTIYDVEISHYTSNEVRVSFRQETRKREGPDFPDNIMYGTIILRPENGQWKWYDQLVYGREELN